jgi:hypothetical protein
MCGGTEQKYNHLKKLLIYDKGQIALGLGANY